MKTLDCGCEVTPDGNSLLSLCTMHGGHMRMRQAIESHKPPAVPESKQKLQHDLLVALAPELVRKSTSDPETIAERLDQHVQAILKRA